MFKYLIILFGCKDTALSSHLYSSDNTHCLSLLTKDFIQTVFISIYNKGLYLKILLIEEKGVPLPATIVSNSLKQNARQNKILKKLF